MNLRHKDMCPNFVARCLLRILLMLICITVSVDSSNNTNPLIYTKLRHDENYLQIYRNYQLDKPNKEKKISRTVREYDPVTNKSHDAKLVYYENDRVSASGITQDDLILEALDRTYRSRLIPAYLHTYDNPKDRRDSSDKRKVSPIRCERELLFLSKKLDLLLNSNDGSASISPELAALFDAYASEETGVLMGNYLWTGVWRQCGKRRIFEFDRNNLTDRVDFSARYCVASIKSKNWDFKIQKKAAELEAPKFFKYPEQKYDYARFFRIQLGLCIPESCDSSIIDSQRDLIKKLATHRLGNPYANYDLVDLYCLPDESSRLRQFSFGAWVFIVCLCTWVTLLIVATYQDYQIVIEPKDSNLRPWHKFILAVSIRRNFDKLFEISSLKRVENQRDSAPTLSNEKCQEGAKMKVQNCRLAPNDLIFLNAFKVIGMVCIIYGHCGMMIKHLDRFPLDFDTLDSDLLFHFSASSVFFVDWFFVITGFLTTYVAFVSKRAEKNSFSDWMYMIFHRYLRLAPLYLITFWFLKDVYEHLGAGPLWDYGTNNMTLRSTCHDESWIFPLTMTSNLHAIHDECLMPSWYISNDMQFFIITPLIIVLLAKFPIGGWMACLGMIGACISERIRRYMTDPRAQHLELMRPRYDLYVRNNWDMHATYVQPQYRIASYLVGILGGHYAYMVLSGRWSSFMYHNPNTSSSRSANIETIKTRKDRNRLLIYVFGSQLALTMMFATWFISDLYPVALEDYVKYFTSLIYGASHTTCSLGMTLILLGLLFGQFAGFKQFLEHPLWTVLSRLNFFVYLIQVEVVYYVLQSDDHLTQMNCSLQHKYWIMVTAICYLIAPVLTILFEYPLAHLEREFLGRYVLARKGQNVLPPSVSIIHGKRMPLPDGSEGRGGNNVGANLVTQGKAHELMALTDDSTHLFEATSRSSDSSGQQGNKFTRQKQRKSVGKSTTAKNQTVEVQVE